MKLTIFVPKAGTATAAMIAPKSAVVASDDQAAGRRVYYYEGNLNGAVNLNRFFEKLNCAAGRLVQKYPTVAMAAFPDEDLTPVATYETDTWSVTAVSDPEALTAWAGEALEAIAGVPVEPGQVPFPSEKLSSAYKDARFLGQKGMRQAFRTLAGQTIVFDHARPGLAEVLDARDNWDGK